MDISQIDLEAPYSTDLMAAALLFEAGDRLHAASGRNEDVGAEVCRVVLPFGELVGLIPHHEAVPDLGLIQRLAAAAKSRLAGRLGEEDREWLVSRLQQVVDSAPKEAGSPMADEMNAFRRALTPG